MTAVRIDERALLSAGVDRATVAALRHVLTQVGELLGGATLPEVAEQVDLNNPIIVALQLATTVLQAQAAILEAEQASVPPSDKDLRHQIEEMAAELQTMRIANNRLEKRVEILENGVE